MKRDYVQAQNPRSKRWLKINRLTGELLTRKYAGQWAGIPIVGSTNSVAAIKAIDSAKQSSQ